MHSLHRGLWKPTANCSARSRIRTDILRPAAVFRTKPVEAIVMHGRTMAMFSRMHPCSACGWEGWKRSSKTAEEKDKIYTFVLSRRSSPRWVVNYSRCCRISPTIREHCLEGWLARTTQSHIELPRCRFRVFPLVRKVIGPSKRGLSDRVSSRF